MVKTSDVQTWNSTLKNKNSGLVAVVAGGTNGIGLAFLRELTAKSDGPRIYFLGRDQSSLSRIQSELETLNPSGEYIPVHASDLRLLSIIDQAADQIKAMREKKIDILFMSQGYLTLSARDETTEGIDKLMSIRFYGRMRLVENLLPLLNVAPSPHVISILAGGQEGVIDPNDIAMVKPENYSVIKAAFNSATLSTLYLEQLHKENTKISFVHVAPGFVKTNLFHTEHFHPIVKFIINYILIPIFYPFVGISVEESGQRSLYAATNSAFSVDEEECSAIGSNGVKSSGVYTLGANSDAIHDNKVLEIYRQDGTANKIVDFVRSEFSRVEKMRH